MGLNEELINELKARTNKAVAICRYCRQPIPVGKGYARFLYWLDKPGNSGEYVCQRCHQDLEAYELLHPLLLDHLQLISAWCDAHINADDRAKLQLILRGVITACGLASPFCARAASQALEESHLVDPIQVIELVKSTCLSTVEKIQHTIYIPLL